MPYVLSSHSFHLFPSRTGPYGISVCISLQMFRTDAQFHNYNRINNKMARIPTTLALLLFAMVSCLAQTTDLAHDALSPTIPPTLTFQEDGITAASTTQSEQDSTTTSRPTLTIPFYATQSIQPVQSASLLGITSSATTLILSSRTVIYGNGTYSIEATISALSSTYSQTCKSAAATVNCEHFHGHGADGADNGVRLFPPAPVQTALVVLTAGAEKMKQQQESVLSDTETGTITTTIDVTITASSSTTTGSASSSITISTAASRWEMRWETLCSAITAVALMVLR